MVRASVVRAIAGVGLVAALPLRAADVAASDAGAGPASGTIEEIVVTAEKREESAQRTPISMDVFSGEELISRGVAGLQSLTRVDPSLNFTTSTGGAYIALRGIASTDLTETGDPAVAVSRDGFFTNRSFGLFASMYDVARVEVLKGPQGTLYGRNTAGGVINIISQRPTGDFGGYASLTAGDYNTLNIEGAINLPVNEVVQVRLSGVSQSHSGYRNNPGFPAGDDADNRSARAQIAFQPWDGFKGLLSAQEDVQHGTGDVAASAAEGNTAAQPGIAVAPKGGALVTPPVPYNLAGGFPLYAPFNVDMKESRFRWEFSQQLPYDLAVTYLGGYDKTSWSHALDGTTFPGTKNPPAQFLQQENPETQNHELRLTQTAGPLFWQVGGFYFREANGPLTSGLLEEGGQFNNDYLVHFAYQVLTTSKAGFGQVDYQATDEFKLSAGGRYTQDHKERTGLALLDLTVASGGFLANPFPGCYFGPNPAICSHLVVPTPGNGDITNSRFTYHVGADWTPTPTTLVYVKYDTGYKSGGFNSNGSAPSVNYGPETVGSAEIGTKNRLLNDALQANLSLFDMRYKGYQASQFTQVISGSASGVFNAGDANIYGAEGEVIWLPTKLTRVDLNAVLLHSKFSDGCAVDSSVTYSATAPACGTPLSGDYLPNAPAVSLTGGIEQTLLDPYGGHWTASLQGKYQSHFYFDIFMHEDTSQRASASGDFTLRYAPSAAKWSVEAFIRNFANTVVLANAARNGVAFANNYEFAPPRTLGVTATARF